MQVASPALLHGVTDGIGVAPLVQRVSIGTITRLNRDRINEACIVEKVVDRAVAPACRHLQLGVGVGLHAGKQALIAFLLFSTSVGAH